MEMHAPLCKPLIGCVNVVGRVSPKVHLLAVAGQLRSQSASCPGFHTAPRPRGAEIEVLRVAAVQLLGKIPRVCLLPKLLDALPAISEHV
jgi:hypothetical protein